MFLRQLWNLPTSRFILHHTDVDQDALTLVVESRSKRCHCPACHQYSRSIHSSYQRCIKDLPCFALKTRIRLTTYKFYCRNPHCPQKIFNERFAAGFGYYKRMTDRLSDLLSSLVLQLTGRSAERICYLLHIDVSDTTLREGCCRSNPYQSQSRLRYWVLMIGR